MKAIKTGLMVMGVLIVVGFSFLGYVLYQRMTGTGYFAKNHVETAPIDFAAGLLVGLIRALALPFATGAAIYIYRAAVPSPEAAAAFD